MTKNCNRCNQPLTARNSIRICGKEITVCRDCAESIYSQCPSCKQYVCSDDMILANDDFICLWCISEKFVLCPHCSSFFKETQMVKFHGHLMCRECRKEYFEECALCRNSFEHDELETILHDDQCQQICMKCLKKNYFVCDNCGDHVPRSERCLYQGETLCKECFKFSAAEAIPDDISEDEAVILQTLINAKIMEQKVAASRNYGNSHTSKNTGSHCREEYCENCSEKGYESDCLNDGLCP